jgi:hypothetical protein
MKVINLRFVVQYGMRKDFRYPNLRLANQFFIWNRQYPVGKQRGPMRVQPVLYPEIMCRIGQ